MGWIFFETFEMNNTSAFFVEKPRNSRISLNYALITFAQYCIYQTAILKYRESRRVVVGVINTRRVVLSNLCCTILYSSFGLYFEKKNWDGM